jgi:hypothetical protein
VPTGPPPQPSPGRALAPLGLRSAEVPIPEPIRNRIQGHRRVRAGDLIPRDWNYRLQPDGQRAAPEQFLFLVTCRDEQHQAELLGCFQAEGLDCRALLS